MVIRSGNQKLLSPPIRNAMWLGGRREEVAEPVAAVSEGLLERGRRHASLPGAQQRPWRLGWIFYKASLWAYVITAFFPPAMLSAGRQPGPMWAKGRRRWRLGGAGKLVFWPLPPPPKQITVMVLNSLKCFRAKTAAFTQTLRLWIREEPPPLQQLFKKHAGKFSVAVVCIWIHLSPSGSLRSAGSHPKYDGAAPQRETDTLTSPVWTGGRRTLRQRGAGVVPATYRWRLELYWLVALQSLASQWETGRPLQGRPGRQTDASLNAQLV